MENFVFVILNYNSTEETISCIESINNLNYSSKFIVVVDNASNNQDDFIEDIKQYCKDLKYVHVLKSTINTGYACGNNIGIDYAKRVLKADFICVVNPDISIKTVEFIQKSVELYKKYGYSICGPQIINNGKNCNPIGGYKESIRFVLYHIWENYRIILVKKLKLARFNIIKKYKTKKIIKQDILKNVEIEKETLLDKAMEKQLSGACLVFSPSFFESFNGFCEKTFLYCEESILTCVCLNTQHKILYTDRLKTYHKGGASMNNSIDDSLARQIRISKIGAKSCWVVLDILLHKNDKNYLKKCLNPSIEKYEVVK